MRVAIGRSRILTGSIVVVAGLALSSIAVAQLSSWAAIPLALLVVAIAGHALAGHALRFGDRSIVQIEFQGRGANCMITDRSGVSREAYLAGESVAWNWVVLMRLRVPDARHMVTLLVIRDAVEREAWRRSSTWVRWALEESAS